MRSNLIESIYETKVMSYNSSDCWKYFIPQHIFIFCSVQISNKKSVDQYIIQYTHPNVQLLRVLRVSFQHPVRIVVRLESALMSIDWITNQFKSCFIRENYIEKKVGVTVSFFHHEFANFPTTIKIIFVQLLYQINFIWMKLDFFQNFLHKFLSRKVSLKICLTSLYDHPILASWEEIFFLILRDKLS